MLTKVLKQVVYGLFFFVVGVSYVNAASIGVSPVRATLSENQQIEAITLRNNGTKPATLQLEVMSWSQQNGKDIFKATRDVLANPPIVTVPAGGSQLVRFGLRRAPNLERELTYRIFIEELAPPPDPDFMGSNMMLRISLPVFVLPKTEVKPVLLWEATITPQGDLKLNLTNSGKAHIQIANFRLSLPNSEKTWVTQQSGDYVLPGQTREWIIPANQKYPTPPQGSILGLSAQTDIGDMQAEVVILR